MTDDLTRRLRALDPVPDPPQVPSAVEMRRRIASSPRRWLGRPRALPTIVAGLLAAGAVATVSTATGGGGEPQVAPKAPTRIAEGRELATRLAGGEPVGVAATGLDASVIEVLATGGYGVVASRAWELPIPGADRRAWLFAGARRLALVVPRTLADPSGKRRGGAVSIFGGTATDIGREGLVGSQAGGGQSARVIVLLPPDAPAPSVVRAGTDERVRGVPHQGRLFLGQPRAGEQVLVPSQPAGRRRLGAAG